MKKKKTHDDHPCCPLCKKRCPLDKPHCKKGEKYARKLKEDRASKKATSSKVS